MSRRHLLIGLEQDEDGYPPFKAEKLDAIEVGDHRFRLDAVPAFAFGVAKGDVVRVERYEGDLWIVELLEPSGHSTVRLIGLGTNSVETPRGALEDLGCATANTVIDGMISVDVPPSVEFETVYEYLMRGQATSTWDFNVGVRGDGEPL
jgi:hypothetical protein